MSYYGIVLYPQYPVGNCIVDFGNPVLKIGLGLDGAEYHDSVKDYKRDLGLKREYGWNGIS